MTDIERGEIFLIDLNPVRGREQAGRRPGLVISVAPFNQGGSGLIIVLPITSRQKGIPTHVPIEPPEGGLRVRSFVKCEDIRSLSVDRLIERWGKVSPEILVEVENRLRILMGL